MSVNEQPAILVGIDGSEASRNALSWASKLADRIGARIDTVAAWQLSSSYLMPIVLSLIHISEPTRLLSISYAVFCLKKIKKDHRRQ